MLAAAALLGHIGYRMTVGMHYHWHWSAIPQYLFRMDQNGNWTANLLMQGFFTTIRLSIWATLLATILGTVAGFFRISKSLFKRLLGRTFVELIRNTPPLVLIFIFYFFVSDQIMPVLGVDDFARNASERMQGVMTFLFAPPRFFTAFISATVTVAIIEAAYITEIIRAGIQSIEKGQFEACHALGLSWKQKMRYVILPQAIQRILPPLAGQFISTIKDSAIVSVISIPELCFQGMELMAATYLTFECWITITVLYLILTLSLSLAVERLEIFMKRSSI
ncbi:MAG: amino acid ABC transporter permease [Deltaproteobacteria bacterium]|nr:amino acid ABC transporter permease [Deltaproteobacteria bacterium]